MKNVSIQYNHIINLLFSFFKEESFEESVHFFQKFEPELPQVATLLAIFQALAVFIWRVVDRKWKVLQ